MSRHHPVRLIAPIAIAVMAMGASPSMAAAVDGGIGIRQDAQRFDTAASAELAFDPTREAPWLAAPATEAMVEHAPGVPVADVVDHPQGLVLVSAEMPERFSFAVAGASVVDEEALERMRGGFDMPGLKMSFGIERAVYINGELLSTTTLNLADLGAGPGAVIGNLAVAGDAATAVRAGQTIALIQNGPNNTFLADFPSSATLPTVIQNSLDNQTIRTLTSIDLRINSLEVLRAHRIGESFRDAYILSR